jgi:D-sedoheptulose 7-phosphate isomerase
MTMLEQRVQQQFFESADLQYQSAEALARPIAEAATALLGAITGGGKVMVTGNGAGAALAAHLAQVFVTRFERERPPLAAMALSARPAAQVRALGLPGDVLLLIHDGDTEGDSESVIAAAQAKDMTLVVLVGRGAAAMNELLAETDVLIAVPAERLSRVAELQLLVLHCLCDAVDFQLMGEQEP